MNIIVDENIPLAQAYFSQLGHVIAKPGRQLSSADVRTADALIVRSVTPVNAALLEGSNVNFVGTCTIGLDHLETQYLTEQGIAYINAPGCNANSVVEYVFAALAATDTDWHNRKVGIIGCGNVGGAVYRKLQAMGAECCAYDPFLKDEKIRTVSLDEALQSSIICVHTPLTTTGEYPSWHMLDEAKLRALPENATLISAGRGGVIDNQALRRVLSERDDITVILDVWEPEPDIDTRLLQQVDLGTPHIAGYSYDGKVAGTQMIYAALCEHWQHAVIEPPADLTTAYDINVEGLLEGELSETQQLHKVLRQMYDIEQDHQQLCRALDGRDMGLYFDQLRKGYPKRREFWHYQIDQQAIKKPLAKTLAALGIALK